MYKFLKWTVPPEDNKKDKDGEEEDVDLDYSDEQFKLMALILDSKLSQEQNIDELVRELSV